MRRAWPDFDAKRFERLANAGLQDLEMKARAMQICAALVAARRFGIDPAVANRVFNASSGRNNTTDTKVESFMLSGRFDSGFAAALMRKDVDTALALTESLGSERALMQACAALWQQAQDLVPAQGVEPYTQGLMDLGATLCTARNPACERCPLSRARSTGRTSAT